MTVPLFLLSVFVAGFVSLVGTAQNNAAPPGMHDKRPIKKVPPPKQEEHPITLPPPPKIEWSATELALRAAMETDPTCTTKSGAHLTQTGAIAGWRRFLERDDLSKEQQAYAWWRLGSLYAYNFNPNRGEKADEGQAEQAFAKARALFGDLLSSESLNSATVYATLVGKPKERAHRLAKTFNWLTKRSEKDIERSAQQINRSGSVLDKKFFPNIAHRESNTLEERKQFLREQLAEYRKLMAEIITEAIQYSQDPAAIAELLKSIEDAADKKQMKKWRPMQRELKEPPAPPNRKRERQSGAAAWWISVILSSLGFATIFIMLRRWEKKSP